MVTKNQIGESKVIEYYRKKGCVVYHFVIKGRRNNLNEKKGTPDFLIRKDNERFYVEEKTDMCGLSLYQEEVIQDLLSRGEMVVLARYDTKNKKLKLWKLNMMELLDEVTI
jgi:hypothetical protein